MNVARALLALSVVGLATSAVAQTPRTISAIPIFTGATRSTVDESMGTPPMELRTEAGDSLPVRSSEILAYEAAAHADAVFSFYKQRLGGKVEYGPEDMDFEKLARGAATPVIRGENFHDMEDMPGDLGIDAVSAAKKRAMFAGRQPVAPGQYFSDGGFEWMVKEANGDVTRFGVNIQDAGLEAPWKSYKPRTLILVSRVTFVNPASAVADADAADRSSRRIAIQKDVEALGSGPSEATLGVPAYPGATFDARNSAGASRGDTKYYLYFTNDDVAKVVAFYQDKLGKTATDIGGGEKGIVLEGRMPFPVHGVFVKANTVMPGGKTMITVVRKGE